MIENLWPYAILPLVPAAICLLLLTKLYKNRAQGHYLKLFSNLMLMNIAQAIGYVAFSVDPIAAERMADLYLISGYFFFTHLLMTAICLSNNQLLFKRLSLNWLYLAPLSLTVLHISGFIVESYRMEQNAVMHNDGTLAWCLDAYILSTCMITIALLCKNIKSNKGNRMLASKNMVALISFVPLVAVFILLVILSTTRYAIPVVVIGPVITLYTAMTFFYISRQRVIDLSIGLKFFYDRLKLAYLLLETHKTKDNLKSFSKAVDKQFIKEALEENNRHIQATADYLGMNHTTLRNKIKEYGLS